MIGHCEDCRFWERSQFGPGGTCHRYPPTRSGAIVTWPSTDADDWCGEFGASEEIAGLAETSDKSGPEQ
jgi:hypothetical protein